MEFLFQGKLNKIDENIARILYSERHDIANKNISEVAEHCNVSPSKITKYCKKIGLDGFKELKFKMMTYDVVPSSTSQSFLSLRQKNEEFWEKFDYQKFDEFKQLLLETEKIVFFGKGPSYHLSEFFAPRLRILLNKEVNSYVDDLLMDMELENNAKEKVIVFLTASSATDTVNEKIEKAHRNPKNKVVVICENGNDFIYKNSYLAISMLPDMEKFDYRVLRGRILMFTYLEILTQEFNR